MFYLLLHKATNRRFWVHSDIARLGTEPPALPRLGKAVICGTGVAGLVAARACLVYFNEVVLVDPEFGKTLSGEKKRRIMQYDSIHVYGIPFAMGLRRLWPKFEERANEARQSRFNGDYNLHVDGKFYSSPVGSSPASFSMRRSSLEPLLHKLLVDDTAEAKTRLTVIDGSVSGFESTYMGDRIGSVAIRRVDGADTKITDIDLLIDCTGRAQCGAKWLEAAGFETPQVVTYSPHLRYLTITFDVSDELWMSLPIPESVDAGCAAFYPDPDVSRAGMILQRVDNGAVHLCLISWGPHTFPKTPEEILPCISSFGYTNPIPEWLVKTVRVLVDEGSPHDFASAQIASCTLLNYHQMTRHPANFIALGDSVMLLNPVFGQGCVKAMAGVLTLDSMLRDRLPGKLPSSFPKQFFQKQAERTKNYWVSNKAADYGYPTTEPTMGETRANGAALRWMSMAILMAAEIDSEIGGLLLVVRHLLAPETAFFRPKILGKIVWAHVKRALGWT